jgi:hypothetical protein
MDSSAGDQSKNDPLEKALAAYRGSKSLASSAQIVSQETTFLPSIPKWTPDQLEKLHADLSAWMLRAQASGIMGLVIQQLSTLVPPRAIPSVLKESTPARQEIVSKVMGDDGLLKPEVIHIMRLALGLYGPGRKIQFYGGLCARACAIVWLSHKDD